MPDVLAEIAADFHARLADGGTEPPLRGLKLVRDHRLGAVRLARDLGGAGYTLTEFFDHVIALAAADPDLAHILRIHYSLVEELQVTPTRPGSDRWIGIVAEGGLIGGTNTELSQKSVGGNNRDTRLAATEGGLRLRGRKFYSTGAQFSDYLRVTAQDDDGAPTAVVIPADRAGVEHADDWDGIGQRQTGSGTTIFEDVVVEADEVFPLGATIGVDRPRGAFLQLYLHAVAAGILRALAADAAALVRGRSRTFTFAAADQPTADPQLLAIVGEIDAVAYAAQALVRSAAAELGAAADAAYSTGIDTELEKRSSIAAARVKVAIEEPALRAASRIFDAGGASAIQASAVLDRHWRNLRTLFSHNPAVYKARILGDIAVNGVEPPDTSFF
ncbi:Acyl-CoA dehydrogenase related to the alkylation response protein AidB [Mycobacterium numidiamassiliense]|uniref:Acyl-CoA dehydrogenase related to the alkylation response protein AidB n=1 Tax=Mycobacterium numidiamassiliense TaxID=1841861 RepID=A0A2U3PHK8_9MYCO|nr:acyl-CoA dehydrogenase family protein [Mycobacterium numidiamassiliense]SPM43246.1 Acyl-CoA dehydrogenase related to the alkylation response protein AidB [Mycobacterium numidiamassiliense]